MSEATVRSFQLEDAFRLQFLQGARLSPAGTRVVYVVSRTDPAGNDGAGADYANLCLQSLEDDIAFPLTSGDHFDHSPRWSPDGRQISFVSTRAGAPQLFLIAPDGGEARQLTKLAQGVGGPGEWSPDGAQLAFSAGPDPEKLPSPAAPYRVTRQIYRFDSLGMLDGAVQSIYVIAADGGEARQLTDDGHMNTQPSWSPAGDALLYSATFPPAESRYMPGLRIVNLDGVTRDLLWEGWQAMQFAWLPDGERVAFIGQETNQIPGTLNQLYTIDLSGGAPEQRSELSGSVGGGLQGDMPALAFFGGGLMVAPEGQSAYIQVQDGGQLRVYRCALSGPMDCQAIIAEDERSAMLADIDERQLLYVASSHHDPTQLMWADGEGGAKRALTQLNATPLAEIASARVQNFHITGAADDQVECWLMLPPAGCGEAPYPTVLYIHGGPWGAFGNIYSIDFQLLAGAGYAVLFVNYHGSSGYGEAFGQSIQSAWGTLDYEDQMLALDHVIAENWADPERLGVCGISAGGYGSCWMIGQTDRFKAAVPENPVTNLMTIYSVSDIGRMMPTFMGGKPHEAMENYVKCSPITYAHRCITPTLLVQGEADWRCPPEQSEQFYSVLKDNGCVVEMLRLPSSPHVGSIAGPPQIRRAQNEALLGWMNRYLKGEAEGAGDSDGE